MSVGIATRPSGVFSSFNFLPLSPTNFEILGVQTIPGATAFARTPLGPSSTARVRTQDINPALAAPYAACRGDDVIPETDSTKTIDPPPDDAIARPAACENRNAWRNTIPNVQSKSSSLV